MAIVNKSVQKNKGHRGRGRPKRVDGVDPVLSARVPKEMAAEIAARADREGIPRSATLVKIIADGLARGRR